MLIMFRAVQLLSVVTTSFLFLSNIPFSSSSQHSPPFPTHHTSSAELKSGRVVLELMVNRGRRERFLSGGGGDSEEQLNSSLLVLAAKTTYRKDPLNHFHKYTGGWNISNPHYWASVAYTAVPFFFIGAIWFVVFGISLTLICLCFCCCRKEPYGYSRIAYALSLILLTLFTIAAIVGCVVLYTGQGKYHSSSMSTLEYVVQQADTTSENLRNVSQYLAAAKQINVDQVFLPSNVQSDIDLIQNKINSSANILSSQTQDNSHKIKNVIESVRLALIVLSAVMLLLTFLGFVFSIFGMQFLVYLLVIAGWILVTATFILCGIFLLLHNVTGDTCVAMSQWVENPTAHTALDDILPCVDNATAQETLTKSKEVTSQLINLMNTVITNISNNNLPPNVAPFYYNQSGPPVPNLCNPFNPDLTDRACTPFLVNLEDCTFVRETFTDINGRYCPGLRKYSQWIYIGLVMVATAVMLSLLFWVIYGRERRHRVYTKEHMPHHLAGCCSL